jgi:hypothetical protein
MTNWYIGWFMIVLVGLSLPASASSPIYRCTQNGQTVLADRPCDTVAPAAAQSAAVSTQISLAPTVVGECRGQTQYYGAENSQEIPWMDRLASPAERPFRNALISVA